jgi:SAM-dependent methyltransferase
MDDRDVARHWDENAPQWVRCVRAGWDYYREYVNNPAFFALLPDLAGRRVLDVGCGEGRNTRLLAETGAQVVGADISERMIAAAREHEAAEPRGIEYHVASGNDLSAFVDASFDAVVSTMAMMDMADYAGAVREVVRVLRPGGLFQFSITHPCTFPRRWRWLRDEHGRKQGISVGNYFGLQPSRPGEDVDEWFFGAAPAEVKENARKFRIPRFFRTLSTYMNTLIEAGFVLTRLEEPYASDEALASDPSAYDTHIIPYFLIVQCRKAGGSDAGRADRRARPGAGA